LLKNRYGEGVLAEVDGSTQSEREEGLLGFIIIKGVVERRVCILLIIVLYDDRGCFKVRQVIFKLDKELTIVAINVSYLLLNLWVPEV